MNIIYGILVLVVALFLIGATHSGPAYDTRARNALDAFAKELAKEYQLEFLNSGLGLIANAEKGIWALSLVSHKQMTIEQGRQLAATLAYKLLSKVFKDPVFAQYCVEAAIFTKSTEVKEEYVAFRLAFWDQNTDRPLYPYLAQIRLADGNLYYHYADPKTQALQEPIIETLASLQLPSYRE